MSPKLSVSSDNDQLNSSFCHDTTYRSGKITGATKLHIYKIMQTHELTIRIHIAVSERPMYISSPSLPADGEDVDLITFLCRPVRTSRILNDEIEIVPVSQ